MYNKEKNNQSGRSIIEILAVLAIIGILSVAGIAGYSKAMGYLKDQRFIEQASQVVLNIQTKYINQGNYAKLKNEMAINLGIVPKNMVTNKDNHKIGHALGGEIEIYIPIDTILKNYDCHAFEVKFTNVSYNSCVKLTTSEWQTKSGGLIRGGFSNGDNISFYEGKEFPMSLEFASKYCKCVRDGQEVPCDMIFTLL